MRERVYPDHLINKLAEGQNKTGPCGSLEQSQIPSQGSRENRGGCWETCRSDGWGLSV